MIWPKLFRRLVEYLGTGGTVGGFTDDLARDPDRVMVLPPGHFAHLDNLIEQDGRIMR